MNRDDGFIGTTLRKDEFVSDCSDLDNIIVFKQDGNFIVTPIGDKMFVGKDIIYASIWKKNDQHMIYNVIYRNGESGICYGKRFSVTSIIRERDYNVTKGNEKSEIIYFTANP